MGKQRGELYRNDLAWPNYSSVERTKLAIRRHPAHAAETLTEGRKPTMANENRFLGQQMGSYLITEEIASGAFGSVYLARHHLLTGRRVAIKLLHSYRGSAKEQTQFLQEAQFLETLRHRFILPIL